jgi:hypothetical protein
VNIFQHRPTIRTVKRWLPHCRYLDCASGSYEDTRVQNEDAITSSLGRCRHALFPSCQCYSCHLIMVFDVWAMFFRRPISRSCVPPRQKKDIKRNRELPNCAKHFAGNCHDEVDECRDRTGTPSIWEWWATSEYLAQSDIKSFRALIRGMCASLS